MENSMHTLIEAAAQESAAPSPAPVQEDMTLTLRAQELITQARTILDITGVDVFAVYNTDMDVRSQILSGQMDFVALFKRMKPAAQPPAPVRTANGGMGSVNIGGMNDAQFTRLNELLSRGGKVDMRV